LLLNLKPPTLWSLSRILHQQDSPGELTTFLGWIWKSSIQMYLLLGVTNGIMLTHFRNKFTMFRHALWYDNMLLFNSNSPLYLAGQIILLLYFSCVFIFSHLSWFFSLRTGVCLYSQKETMWTICPCIWMLLIQLVCPTVGVDMHSLAWQLLIKSIISTRLEKVTYLVCSFQLLWDELPCMMWKNTLLELKSRNVVRYDWTHY
jgi:hypothetical protein